MSDDRLARVLHAYWGETPGRVRSSMTTSALRFGFEWADANPQPLPRPGDGCQCRGYSQDAGGGHFEYLVEYEPACPEHSEHVYNPRTGVWEHANPQPTTITLAESEAILEAGRAGRYEDHEAALRAAGIEVDDE